MLLMVTISSQSQKAKYQLVLTYGRDSQVITVIVERYDSNFGGLMNVLDDVNATALCFYGIELSLTAVRCY